MYKAAKLVVRGAKGPSWWPDLDCWPPDVIWILTLRLLNPDGNALKRCLFEPSGTWICLLLASSPY